MLRLTLIKINKCCRSKSLKYAKHFIHYAVYMTKYDHIFMAWLKLNWFHNEVTNKNLIKNKPWSVIKHLDVLEHFSSWDIFWAQMREGSVIQNCKMTWLVSHGSL